MQGFHLQEEGNRVYLPAWTNVSPHPQLCQPRITSRDPVSVLTCWNRTVLIAPTTRNGTLAIRDSGSDNIALGEMDRAGTEIVQPS